MENTLCLTLSPPEVLQHIHGCKKAWLPVQLHWARVSDTDTPPDHSPGHRLCFQGRCCFDLADWPPLCSALARTFSKTWEVKKSFILALLWLYHSWALGARCLAPPARCLIGLLWDEPKYENPVGAMVLSVWKDSIFHRPLPDFLMLTEAAHLLRVHLLCLNIWRNWHSDSQWFRWRYFCDTDH